MPAHEKINYVEFPANDLERTKAFFEAAFGWSFVDYGPEYAAFSDQGLDGGFFLCRIARPLAISRKAARIAVEPGPLRLELFSSLDTLLAHRPPPEASGQVCTKNVPFHHLSSHVWCREFKAQRHCASVCSGDA